MGRAREKCRYPCGAREWAWLGSECASWCCQQCLVFISWLVLEPMWLTTAQFRCDSSTGSVGVTVSKWWLCCFLDSPEKKQSGTGKWDNSHVVGLQSTGVRHLLYQKMSVWVDAVSSLGVSLHLVLVRALSLLPCVSGFLSQNGWQAEKVGGGGPSVAQCPQLATLGSVLCLRGSCAGMQEWGSG